jgi:hypothetical protein
LPFLYSLYWFLINTTYLLEVSLSYSRSLSHSLSLSSSQILTLNTAKSLSLHLSFSLCQKNEAGEERGIVSPHILNYRLCQLKYD